MIVRNSFSLAFFSKSIDSRPLNIVLVLSRLLGIDRFVFETNIVKVVKIRVLLLQHLKLIDGVFGQNSSKFRMF